MKKMMHLGLTIALGLSSLPLTPLMATAPAMAQQNQNLTAQQILQRAVQKHQTVSYTGKKKLVVHRQKSAAKAATADIVFQDKDNYEIKITGPADIRGILFRKQDGRSSAFFPDEKLHLQNAVEDAMYIPEQMVFSGFSKSAAEILSNYDVIKQADAVEEMRPVYVLDFVPKHRVEINGNEYWPTPRRRYWIEKSSFQVLKENRYWDMSNNPYSESEFEVYEPRPVQVPPFDVKGKLNNVDLSQDKKSGFASYASVAAAEAAEKIKINAPNYVPTGFKLTNIQVFDLFGSRIQVINYNDGLNDLMLTIRPEQNGFVTLLAGAFSLGLIKKITDLSYQAPNNYYSTSTNQRIAVSFGDMIPAELQRVASSLSLTR